MMYKRIHNTDIDNIDLTIKYNQKDFDFKPKGLWYALDNEWLDWCYCEMPYWIHKNIFELKVDLSKMLIINNKKELDSFNKKYNKIIHENISVIDWESVKKYYTGIEILNYNKLKLEYDFPIFYIWFYGLDVSGGCIWDLSIIKNLSKLTTPKRWFKSEIV